jgi:hypothetical protein
VKAKATSTKSLPREEWDFRAAPHQSKIDWSKGYPIDFLPETEVWYCWQYEFDRERLGSSGALEWRKSAKIPTDFNSLLEHYGSVHPFGKDGSQ